MKYTTFRSTFFLLLASLVAGARISIRFSIPGGYRWATSSHCRAFFFSAGFILRRTALTFPLRLSDCPPFYTPHLPPTDVLIGGWASSLRRRVLQRASVKGRRRKNDMPQRPTTSHLKREPIEKSVEVLANVTILKQTEFVVAQQTRCKIYHGSET